MDFQRINYIQLKLHKIKLLVDNKRKQCLLLSKDPTNIQKGFDICLSVSIRTFLMVMGNQKIEQQKFLEKCSIFKKFRNMISRNKGYMKIHSLFI